MKSLREEATFNRFYEAVYQESKDLTTKEPSFPRHRKLPRRYDGEGQAHQYEELKAGYRHAYFETLELAAANVEKRFHHKDIRTIQEIETLLLKAGNGETVDSLSSLVQSYLGKDFDLKRLKIQLSLVHNMMKTANSESVPVTKVTNVRTIAEAMNTSDIYKTMLSEVNKLLKLYFTFPVTTATAEWSFSSLRRIKTFLRSTMTECRLNNLFCSTSTNQ